MEENLSEKKSTKNMEDELSKQFHSTLSYPHSQDDSDEEINVPEWAELENIKTVLEKQSESTLYDLFGKDLFHPPIDKMMQMTPHSARKFTKRTDSADWAHMNMASPKRQEQFSALRDRNKLQKQWAMKDFEVGRTLGKGRFSTTYLVREKTSGVIVVLKVVYKSVLAKLEAERAIRSEIEIQAHMRHQNIVQIYGYFFDESRIYLVLEYALHGDLFSEVKLCRLEEHMAAPYVYQVACALEYMHKNFVIHRDIKLENTYINENNQIKVGDFGWAIHTHSMKSRDIVGTTTNLAPEMLTSREYDGAVDVWALGVLMYEMLVGELPFYGTHEEETRQQILTKDLKCPGYLSPECTDLIHRMLQRDPTKRITSEEIKSHPWIKDQCGVQSLKKMCIRFITETKEFWPYDFSNLDSKLKSELLFDSIAPRFYEE